MGDGALEPSDWSAKWIGDKLPSVEKSRRRCSPRVQALIESEARNRLCLGARRLRTAHQRAAGRRSTSRAGVHRLSHPDSVSGLRCDVASASRAPTAIGAMLGDGWYAGGIGLGKALVKKPRNIYGDHPRLIAQLEIELADGRQSASSLTIVAHDARRTDCQLRHSRRRGLRCAARDARLGLSRIR